MSGNEIKVINILQMLVIYPTWLNRDGYHAVQLWGVCGQIETEPDASEVMDARACHRPR